MSFWCQGTDENGVVITRLHEKKKVKSIKPGPRACYYDDGIDPETKELRRVIHVEAVWRCPECGLEWEQIRNIPVAPPCRTRPNK